MSRVSQLNNDLKFGIGGTSYIYVNTGNTGALTFMNYEDNPIRYLTVDSLNNRVIIPTTTPLKVTNATITNLTVTNLTGTNYVLTGPTGSAGTIGLQGLFGSQGNQGDQGIQGLQDLQGITGTQGLQGLQGFQGIEGLQGFQGNQGITTNISNIALDRIITSTTTSTGLNAEADLTFSNDTLYIGNDISATGLFILSTTGIGSATGLMDSAFAVNISHGSTGVYSITNLANLSSNNGKETTLLNFYPGTGIYININTVDGTTYATGSVEYSTSLVFYDGSWYISGKY